MSREKNQTCAFDFYKNESVDRIMNEKLLSNGFFSSIIDSEEFQRLQQVSFLGAIDYVNPENKATRYQHSLDVAKLALYISEKRGYSDDITNHVVSAALLHDIGHAPLSHSMEQSFFDTYGINHHIASSKLIKSGKDINSVTNILKKNVDVDLVINLIEQESNEPFADIFNSKINVDTIDGIHKSLAFINLKDSYDKYALAQSVFTHGFQNTTSRLDHFWSVKDFVYKKIITSGIGAIADHVSKEYFIDNISRLNESYFLKKESSLLGGRNPIFKDFSRKVRGIKFLGESVGAKSEKLNVTVMEREYKTNVGIYLEDFDNVNDFINSRYQVKKFKVKKELHYVFINGDELKMPTLVGKSQCELFG
ncbi:HD domain-containing protein [Photobacterium leiognathi]|uniref:HD domain-containing protein n=1 Tax=Photobacterium leiognathi TaxID=553611 RepID=UPI00273A3E78|nr:HD domain-containing protein [Photobacterium leiognathi]